MFTRVSIPTPFQVGPVNAYIARRTIVDPGPDSEEAWSRLVEALEARELSPDDIEQVLVTHPHPDHFGMANRFAERGARVLASEPAADIMRDFAAQLHTEQSYFADFFERCGVSRETAETVTQLPEAFLPYAQSVDTDRALAAGDIATVDDTELTVDTVQGHSAGEIIFSYDFQGRREAIVGDNVLGDITPNPFLQVPTRAGRARGCCRRSTTRSGGSASRATTVFSPATASPLHHRRNASTTSSRNTTSAPRRSPTSSPAGRRHPVT